MNSIVKNKEKLQKTKKTNGIVKRFNYFVLSLIILLSSFSFSYANTYTIQDLITDNTVSFSGDYTYINPYQNRSIDVGGTLPYLLSGCSTATIKFSVSNFSGQYDNGAISIASNSTPTTISYDGNPYSSGTKYVRYYGSDTSEHTVTFTFNNLDGTYFYFGSYRTGSNTASMSASYELTIHSIVLDNVVVLSDSITEVKYPFTLQNGYLFVYDLGSNSVYYSFDLSSKSEEYSNIGSNPFPDTNQSYWFSDTLPEIDETTIPASGAAIINWSKGDNTNIFGQTQNMVASISGTSSGRYLYIYNPPVHYKWSGSSNPTASEVVNYPMVINGVSENDNWYIYDSIARLTDFNQGGSVTGTITGEQIIGTVTSDGSISLNTSSGAIYTQSSGGSTDISGANGGSIAENINGLKQTLDNFVNQFIQLLSAPISHIQQLIQSSNQFFDVFSQLFEWLPNELSSVIVSGLIIMVVIGVIKMLL